MDGLLPFINKLTVPVVDANLDISEEPRLQGKIKRSLVIERGGEKIGIVGYITTETVYSASPGKIQYENMPMQYTAIFQGSKNEKN